jgi:hypothetical protein
MCAHVASQERIVLVDEGAHLALPHHAGQLLGVHRLFLIVFDGSDPATKSLKKANAVHLRVA